MLYLVSRIQLGNTYNHDAEYKVCIPNGDVENEKNNQLFVSKYQLYLLKKELLVEELNRLLDGGSE